MICGIILMRGKVSTGSMADDRLGICLGRWVECAAPRQPNRMWCVQQRFVSACPEAPGAPLHVESSTCAHDLHGRWVYYVLGEDSALTQGPAPHLKDAAEGRGSEAQDRGLQPGLAQGPPGQLRLRHRGGDGYATALHPSL